MSKYSKRHFTVVIKNKEHGLYISSKPSLAAKKAVSKLCASNKQKKVEFHIREITRDSKKKTYGPYIGYVEKLRIQIKLKEYIIKYNPVAKLKKKSTVKKVGMIGGKEIIYVKKENDYNSPEILPYFEIQTTTNIKNFSLSNLVFNNKKYFNYKNDFLLSHPDKLHTLENKSDKKFIYFTFRNDITEDILQKFLEDNKPNILKKLEELGIRDNVKIYLNIPYILDEWSNSVPKYKKFKYIIDSEITSNDYSNMVNQLLETNNHKNNNKYLNQALRAFGIKKSLLFFGDFLNYFDDNLPIISVGSGTAYFEYLIQEIFRREIICVDPYPKIYLPENTPQDKAKLFIKPKFKFFEKYLEQTKNTKNTKNNLLILNWPPPSLEGDKSVYDYPSIIELKPIGFFIVYEKTGISGSRKLRDLVYHSWKDTLVFKNKEEKVIVSYELLESEEKKEVNQEEINKARKNLILKIPTTYIMSFYRRIDQ
jgi:hypothetical protein